MKVVGLTGGIGSGKTTVSDIFKELGVPVYIADEEAQRLMNKSKVLIKKITKLFGEKAYNNDGLNKDFIASKIFTDKGLLEQMNNIVHPKVGKHFKKWVSKQDYPYIIKEAAIIFENNSYKQFDFIITVVADKELRIKRLLKRDKSTEEKIKAIMSNQWPDEKKVELSDFIIKNLDLNETKKQVSLIHKTLLKLSTLP